MILDDMMGDSMEPEYNSVRRTMGSRANHWCAYLVLISLESDFWKKFMRTRWRMKLRKAGLHVEQQRSVVVYYDNIAVGEYHSDILVDNVVILELKLPKQSTILTSRNH